MSEAMTTAPRAEARVGSGPFRILFVCTANICRSAYAEAAARQRSSALVEFESAGTHALDGRGMDPLIAALLPPDAAPYEHRARQLVGDQVSRADLVLVMASDHRRFVLDEWPRHGRKTFVIGHVARVFSELPDGVELDRVAAHLWSRRSADPSDEVPDPYGQGRSATADAARAIDRSLEVILQRLERLARHR